MPPDPKPTFVQLNGEIVPRNPVSLKGARRYSYVLQGTLSNLHDLCDKWINKPFGGKYTVRPHSDLVILTFVNSSCTRGGCAREDWLHKGCLDRKCAKAAMMHGIHHRVGHFKYNQVELTILVQTPNGQIQALSPFVFVDDNAIMTVQREMLGLNTTMASIRHEEMKAPKAEDANGGNRQVEPERPPKAFCRYEFDETNDHMALEVIVPEPAPSDDLFFKRKFRRIPRKMMVMRLRKTPHENATAVIDVAGTRQALWDHRKVARGGVQDFLVEQCGDTHSAQVLDSYASAITMGRPQLAMNQFRSDIEHSFAFYQVVQNFMHDKVMVHDAGLIAGPLDLEINREVTDAFYTHYPLIEDLGLAVNQTDKTSTLPVLAAFWMDCDYSLQPRKVLYNSLKEDQGF